MPPQRRAQRAGLGGRKNQSPQHRPVDAEQDAREGYDGRGQGQEHKTAKDEIDQECQQNRQKQFAAEIRLRQRSKSAGRRERVSGRLGLTLIARLD